MEFLTAGLMFLLSECSCAHYTRMIGWFRQWRSGSIPCADSHRKKTPTYLQVADSITARVEGKGQMIAECLALGPPAYWYSIQPAQHIIMWTTFNIHTLRPTQTAFNLFHAVSSPVCTKKNFKQWKDGFPLCALPPSPKKHLKQQKRHHDHIWNRLLNYQYAQNFVEKPGVHNLLHVFCCLIDSLYINK